MKINDRVCIRETGYAGVVGEIAGNIVYVDMDNGVEMEMKIGDLVLESEYETPFDIEQRSIKEHADETTDKAQAVLDTLKKEIIDIGRMTQENAALLIMGIGGSAGKWDTLNAFQKLNFVAMATSIPVEVWMQGYEDGELAKLQLMAFAIIGEQLKS